MNDASWQGVMQAHGKSFHLATLFFPAQVAAHVKALYALCRWIDDAVDNAPNISVAAERLEIISADLVAEQPVIEVIRLYRAMGLKTAYLTDLVEGVRLDLTFVRIRDTDELLQYCYRVAGTVGLAMSDLMGVKTAKARAFAVDLGIAMQLTNICRDVREDAQMGRCYLPETLLQKHGVTVDELLQCPIGHPGIRAAVSDMLELADRYYHSARMGFASIPFRARGAIIIASLLYRGIGVKLGATGSDPMTGRRILRTYEKSTYLIKGLGAWLISGWQRRQVTHDPSLHLGLEYWKTLRGFAS